MSTKEIKKEKKVEKAKVGKAKDGKPAAAPAAAPAASTAAAPAAKPATPAPAPAAAAAAAAPASAAAPAAAAATAGAPAASKRAPAAAPAHAKPAAASGVAKTAAKAGAKVFAKKKSKKQRNYNLNKIVKIMIDASKPVEDGILNIAAFEKFLQDRIKLNGAAGVLGKVVTVSHDKGKITVATRAHFSKGYFKYLTKKFLKKNDIRDWLHVISTNKTDYQLRYFNIQNDEEEAAAE